VDNEQVYQVRLTFATESDKDVLIELLDSWEIGGIEGFIEPQESFETRVEILSVDDFQNGGA
tara:strand:- start:33 stop:218 length:186 start_codon:yes stop_codon:yes gene_type:complete